MPKGDALIIRITVLLTWGFPSISGIDVPTTALKDNLSIPNGPGLPNVSRIGNSEAFEDAVEYYTAFAGKFFPILSKLLISPKKAKQIWNEVSSVIDRNDLILIFFIGWILVPLVRFPIDRFGRYEGIGDGKRKKMSFTNSYLYLYLDHMSRACRVAALVYLVDCLVICIDTMGFSVKNYSQVAAKIIYTAWIFSRFRTLKDYVVSKKFGTYGQTMTKLNRGSFGRATIVSKISDAALLLFFAFSLFDVLKIKAGGLVKSLFAVGGAGTIVITVACKDIATDVVSGLALQASDKVYEGDRVVIARDNKKDRIATVSKMVSNYVHVVFM